MFSPALLPRLVAHHALGLLSYMYSAYTEEQVRRVAGMIAEEAAATERRLAAAKKTAAAAEVAAASTETARSRASYVQHLCADMDKHAQLSRERERAREYNRAKCDFGYVSRF